MLAERGPSSFTIDAVVERTGVAKTTIYRHWPSRSQLLVAAIGQLGGSTAIPDTGSLRGDLTTYFRERMRSLGADHMDQRLQTLPGILEAAMRDPGMMEVGTEVVKAALSSLEPMLRRARAREELRPDRNIEGMAHILLGASFIHRALGYPVDKAYIDQMVGTFLDGVTLGRKQSGAARAANRKQ